MAANAPDGVRRPVQAIEVATSSAVSTTTPTATRRSSSGWATDRNHTGRGALPGSGIRPSRWAIPRTRGMRITGSNLWTLRSGAPAASRKDCTISASGEPSPPAYPAVSSTRPVSSIVISRPRAGIDRSASPARPPAATSVVASTMTGWVTSSEAAVAVGATNGVQAEVPRNTSVSEVHWVVTPEDSMKSRNGGLTRPSSSSAPAHQATASATVSAHQPVNRHHSRFGRWQAHHTRAGRQAARLATALTAPISARATADCAASIRSGRDPAGPDRASSALITGSKTQGASIIGSVSDEIEPRVVRTRGDSANAPAATRREVGVPIRSASATRSRPQKPAVRSTAHHSRWVTQPGMPSSWPARKKAPCGKR